MKKIIVVLTLLISSVALANDPIVLVIPYATGGPADSVGRVLQQSLSTELGRPVIVETKPGASGEIGTAYVARQPNKTFLVLASASLATNNINKNSAYDLKQDLIPVAYLGHIPLILVVNQQSTFKNLNALIKSQKNLKYGSSGINTSSHLNGEQFQQITNSKTIHVPYKGMGQALPDLLNGELDMAFMSWTMTSQLIEIQKLRPMAVVSDRRLTQLPTIPTFSEIGYPNFGFKTFFILLANRGADSADIENIQQALFKILSDPTLSAPYQNLGLIFYPKDLYKGQTVLDKEIEKYRRSAIIK
jgi:tripartite-type tricarboxylate transporter receptor subunit TctC